MGYGEEETEKSPSSPTTAATAELPGEDRPEEDNGSRHEPSPSWPTRLADFRRMAANQAAQAKSNASENTNAESTLPPLQRPQRKTASLNSVNTKTVQKKTMGANSSLILRGPVSVPKAPHAALTCVLVGIVRAIGEDGPG
jgi:hypothetical protein